MFEIIDAGDGKFVKAWKQGVPFDNNTIEQLIQTAKLPFVYKYVAAMPDAHLGNGSTIGTVLPSIDAICPAAVGVDIGCGMIAQKIKDPFIGGDRGLWRPTIERVVPNGRTNGGGDGDRGAWHNVPKDIQAVWDKEFVAEYEVICNENPGIKHARGPNHLGTLGTGNHFIELSVDEAGDIWIVLHSGSRGLGNKIGSYFSRLAVELCEQYYVKLPSKDLAFIPKGVPEFKRYTAAVKFAQNYAWWNRIIMLQRIMDALGFQPDGEPVHCHHNYISWERHYGQNIMVTRKGAVRADTGMLGIIPGSMGARTYIVRGLGNRDSFCSCSHGAGRKMSRTQAKRELTLAGLELDTAGVDCDKTQGVLDEAPQAYKDIEAVMAAQTDLVEPIARLKQFLCVKGIGDGHR